MIKNKERVQVIELNIDNCITRFISIYTLYYTTVKVSASCFAWIVGWSTDYLWIGLIVVLHIVITHSSSNEWFANRSIRLAHKDIIIQAHAEQKGSKADHLQPLEFLPSQQQRNSPNDQRSHRIQYHTWCGRNFLGYYERKVSRFGANWKKCIHTYH